MAPPVFRDILDGLVATLGRVEGIKQVLDYEPTAIQTTPLVYLLLDSFEREVKAGLVQERYRILVRTCIQWQNNRGAEEQLVGFVTTIPAAVDADPTLGGAITSGLARMLSGSTGFLTVGGAMYRVLDLYADVFAKGSHSYARG